MAIGPVAGVACAFHMSEPPMSSVAVARLVISNLCVSDNPHIEISVSTLACCARTGCAHGRTQGLFVGSPGDTSRGFRHFFGAPGNIPRRFRTSFEVRVLLPFCIT